MRNIGVQIILSILIICGCRKEENEFSKPLYGKLEVKKGDKQTGYFGEFLGDSIILKASSNNNQRRYLIKYEMIQGNGDIEIGYYDSFENTVLIDNTGILKLNWRLGCNNDIQKIKFFLYVDSAKNYYNYNYFSECSDSLTITANGTKPKGWGRSCGCKSLDTYGAKIISYDKNTLYLISRGLYSSNDNGINWIQVEGIPNWEDIVDAQFNSKGWLYVLTRSNGICFSKDLKQWKYINNGILDHRDPTTFLVDDSTIFVSFYFDGPYKTTNNGEFWKKILVGGEGEDRYYCITRHPNGDIYLFDKWDVIWISKDYGMTWKQLSIEYKYTGGIPYDLKIDKNGYMYIGGDDATLSIIDSKTYQGEIHKYYQWNASSQEVKNIQITDDNVFYLVKGNPKPGIYSKLNNWDFLDIKFDQSINYYYLKADNTFMLLSYGGLYYYNKN